ncbi:MAG: FUSC family protein [Solirubrobacteraceae bacterium]
MILAGVHVTHRSSAEPGVGLVGRRTGRRVRIARRGRCPERSPEGRRARPRSAARRDCRIASQAPRQACDRRARCGHRSADVPRRPVGRCPGARGCGDCGARRRRGSTRSAFSPRGDRDDAVPADVRRRAELPRHRQGGRNRGADGARLGVRLPRVDAVARATAAGRGKAPAPPAKPTLGYGVLLGAAGATAAAIGFILDLDHVGWECAAALLVMRPSADMQRLRSAGRILAVAAGALAGAGLVRLHPPAVMYSVAVVAVIAGAGATHRSRWYVTSAFTTFLVFLLLLYSDPQTATKRFNERVLETLLGVAIAYFYGLALPALAQRRRG